MKGVAKIAISILLTAENEETVFFLAVLNNEGRHVIIDVAVDECLSY